MAVEHAANPLIGVDRHRALFHDHFVAVDGAGYLRDDGLNVGKVGCAGVALGSAHGNEDSLASFNCSGQIGRELHSHAPVLCQQLGQMLLEDGNATLAQGLDPLFVVIDTEDMMAHLGKTDGSNESHISGPYHADGN